MEYKDVVFQNSIIQAINTRKLVLFVGAGFSKLCGLPLWNELASALLTACVKENLIDHAEKNQIESGKDSRILITIAYHLFNEKGKLDTFFSIFDKFLTVDEKKSNDENNQRKKLIEIAKKSHATIITTNSDGILHECFEANAHIHYSKDDVSLFKLTDERHLVHLHGYVKDKESLVFTIDQYLRTYSNQQFRRSIEEIFKSDYTILFIGYGLSELQFLDFLVNASSDIPNKYVLEGFFNYESADIKAKKIYYKTLKLQLVTYSKDEKGFTGLIDALEEIINKAEKHSNARSVTYNYALSILNNKPSINAANSLKNELITMNDIEQDMIISNLPKSKYAVEWIISMFEWRVGLYSIFSINNRLRPAIIEGTYFKGVDFAGFRVLSEIYRINKNNRKLHSIMKRVLLEVIQEFTKDNELYTNHYIVGIIQRLIFSDYRLMNMIETYQFIVNNNSINKTSSDWIRWIYYDTDQLKSCKKDVVLKYVKLIIQKAMEKKIQYYEFASFVKKYGNQISKKYPNEVFNILNKIVEEKARVPYWFEFNNSLIQLREGDIESSHGEDSVLVSWFLISLNHISQYVLMKKYKKWFKSSLSFYQKLSIYLLDTNYSLLKDEFFSNEKNPTNNWNIYSEIYLVLKRHSNKFSNDEANIFITWIYKMEIKRVSNFYNKVNKLDLLRVLKENFISTDPKINRQIDHFIDELNSSLSEEEKVKLGTLPVPEARNKKFWSESYTITDDEDFKKLLLSADAEEFVKLISQDLTGIQRHSIMTVFDDCVVKYDIFNWLRNNNFEKINIFPKEYLSNLMSKTLKSDKPISFIYISEFFDNAVSLLEANTRSQFIRDFMHDLYYSYLKEIDNDIEVKSIQDFIHCKLNTIDFKWNKDNKYSEKPTYHTLLSFEVYYPIGILIRTSYQLKNRIAIIYLEEMLADLQKAYVIKAIIASHVGFIWHIDSEWLKSKISSVFNNNVDGYNLSILGYGLSNWDYIEFVRLLYDQNLFTLIVDSDEFRGSASVFIHNILIGFDGNSHNLDILKAALKSNSSLGAIHIYSDMLENIPEFEKYELRINTVLDLASETNFGDIKESGYAIESLLKAYRKFTDKTYIWKLIIHLLKNHDHYFIREIIDLLKQLDISNEMKIDFVVEYIEKLQDHYFHMNEIVELIELPDWSNREFKKQELVNKVGRINPDFYPMFARK